MSKKKLILLIPILAIFLLAGASVALAYTGHFKSLAKVLHISADVVPPPQNYTVCGTDPAYAAFYGVYPLKGFEPNYGHAPYYQKDSNHGISLVPVSGLEGWELSGSYSGGNITFNGWRPDLAIPPEGGYTYNDVPLMMVKIGVVDPSTCQPYKLGTVFGNVTDSTSGELLAGAKVDLLPEGVTDMVINGDNEGVTADTGKPYNYYYPEHPRADGTLIASIEPGKYVAVAYKDGYIRQHFHVEIKAGPNQVDFVLTSNANASDTHFIQGYVKDSGQELLGNIQVNVYKDGAYAGTATTSSIQKSNGRIINYSITLNSQYSAPYKVVFIDSTNQYLLSKYGINVDPATAYSGTQITVNESDFQSYPDNSTTPPKTSRIAFVNAVMDQKDKISLYGDVMAQEDPSIKIPTDLSLVPVDDFNNNTDISTDADGHYDFGNLNGRVTLGIEYRLTATPTSSTGGYRSSETISLVFSKGFSRQIDFKLALNSDRTIRFSGFVRRVDDQGKDLGPIVGATVSLEKGRSAGFGAPISAVDTDVNGYYNLVVSNFWDSDVPNTAAVDLSLIAYDNKSIAANNFQVEYFSINPNEGGVFRQDFNFDSNAKHLNPDPVKDVVINVQGILRGDSITQKFISAGPMSGISVTLTTLRTEDNGNTTTVVSSTQITDVSGNAKFSGFPQKEAKIELGNIPEGYTYVDAKELVLTSSQKAQTIHLLKYNYNFGKLNSPEVLGKFDQQKGPWGDVGFWYKGIPASQLGPDHKTPDSNLGHGGCCLTSLANAIQFYNQGMTVTPDMIANLTSASRDGAISAGDFQALLTAFRAKYGGPELTINASLGQNSGGLSKYSGLPAIYRSEGGIPNSAGGNAHGGHCVLIIAADGKNVTYHDSASHDPNHPVITIPASRLPGPSNPILVVVGPGINAIINSHKTTSFNSHEAFAATLSNQISISDNQDLTISAVAQSLTIIPFDKVYLERNINGQKDYFLMKNTDGNNYAFTIPKGLISDNFSYKIVALNALNKKFTSVDTQVTVTKTPNTFAKIVAKRYSSFAYNLNIYLSTHNVLSSLDNQVQYVIANLKSIYLQILSLFPNAKSKVGSASGQVLISSGSSLISTGPDSDVLVEIGGNVAQVDNNGNYSISNIPAGTYTVTVQGLASVKKGSIPIYSGKEVTIQAGKNVNLNILVNDIVLPFSVTLSASPNPAQAGQPVVFTAKVVGNYTGPLTYAYYCKIGNTQPIRVLKDTPSTNACSYAATSGTYTAKVLVWDSTAKQAQATVAITVK